MMKSTEHERIEIRLPIGCGPDGMRQEFHTLIFKVPKEEKVKVPSPKGTINEEIRPKKFFKAPKKREDKNTFVPKPPKYVRNEE